MKYRIGDRYCPKQSVRAIPNVRRQWGVVTDIIEDKDGCLIEFDCGYKQGDVANIFTEFIKTEDMEHTNPIQFIDFSQRGKNGFRREPNEGVIYARNIKNGKPSGTYQLRLAPICNEATEKGYEFVRVAVNNLTNEVFFVFSEADGLIAKKYDNAPSRISSRDLVMWLEERFDLPKNGGGILLFSDNLSRENGFTYKITAKK